jgi:hypothetical protein
MRSVLTGLMALLVAAGAGAGEAAPTAPGTLRVSAVPGQTVSRALALLGAAGRDMTWQASCAVETASGQAGKVLRTGTLPWPSYDAPLFDGRHIVFEGGTAHWSEKNYHRSWAWKVDPGTWKTAGSLDLDKVLGKWGGWDETHSHSYLACWDGQHFWFRQLKFAGAAKKRYGLLLRAVDWDAGKEVRKIELLPPRFEWNPEGPRCCYSLVCAENALWIVEKDAVSDLLGKEEEALFLTRVDKETGRELGRVRLPEACRNPDGLPAGAPVPGGRYGAGYANGSLWVHTWTKATSKCFRIDPASGRLLGSFPVPLGKYSCGLAHDGRGGLIMVAEAEREVRVVDSGCRVWMSVSPEGGRLPPGGSAELTLRFDPDLAGPGTHRGSVRIHTGDPDRPAVTVPVEFQVGAPAAPPAEKAAPPPEKAAPAPPEQAAPDLNRKKLARHDEYYVRKPMKKHFLARRRFPDGSLVETDLTYDITKVVWPENRSGIYSMSGSLTVEARGKLVTRETALAWFPEKERARLADARFPMEIAEGPSRGSFNSMLLSGSWDYAFEVARVWMKGMDRDLHTPPGGRFTVTAIEEKPDELLPVARLTLCQEGSGSGKQIFVCEFEPGRSLTAMRATLSDGSTVEMTEVQEKTEAKQ